MFVTCLGFELGAQVKTCARHWRAIPLKYGQPELTVDLGVGLWGLPLPYDYDGDGLKDLIVSCPDKPYKGLYYFKNIGSAAKPLFAPAQKISSKGLNNIRLSEVNGVSYVLGTGVEYPEFFTSPYSKEVTLKYEGEVLGENYQRSRSNMWNYVDWDDDGDKDIIVGIDTWDDYGWDNAYDSQGKWKNGPLHGYVYLLENVDGKNYNRGKIIAGKSEIDTYGAPNPCIADFDKDGDLDIICGEFVDGLTWYENVGSRSNPKFTAGRQLTNATGEIRLHVQMIVPVVSDFDGDGNIDLLVGDEDGRVAWVRNTGKVKKHIPQFESPYYLQQQADLVKFGALVTPCSVDWDGDGDEDLVCGNSAGELGLILNVSGGAKPSWDAPLLFESEGKPIRVLAGKNGSIQGPAEAKWGYTVPVVADWDGDGYQDIIINSIWGKIMWYRNPGRLGTLQLEDAKPINVDWNKNEMPIVSWNWWKPEEGTLVTQWRTTPVVYDWNADGLMDMIVLDTEGYPAYFERFKTESGKLMLKPGERIFYGTNCSLYDYKKGVLDASSGVLRLNSGEAGRSGRRKLCLVDWDRDGRMDLMVDSQNVAWFRNVKDEDGKVWFEYMGDISDTILAGHTTSPTTVDWDADGVKDILLGAEDGHLYLIRNLPQPEVVKLFPEGTPSLNGLGNIEEVINEKGYYINVSDPELEIFLPMMRKKPSQMVLVVPGGAYSKVCVTYEGYKTAKWLNEKGIAAAVLKYRLPNGHPDIILEDAQAAMRLIRQRATDWNIDPTSVGIMGFSAGGHFASNLLTKYSNKESRPDYAVLVYPVTSMEYSNAGTREALLGENATDSLLWKTYSPYMNVHEGIPPVLIVVAEDDKAVPYEQSIRMHQELQKVGVKSDLKIYPSGGHGFWMRSKYKHKNDTYPMIIDWIKQYKDK